MVGVGVVSYVEGTGIGPYEGARVQVQASGKVAVATGIGVGNWVEVHGPVTPEARVITRGNERIRPGQQVLAEPIDYPAP